MEGHAEPAQIKVPRKGLGREFLALYPLEERVVLRNPLPPSGELAEPLGRYQVCRLRDLGPVFVSHVVEGAGREWEVSHEEGGALREGDQPLCLRWDVFT